MNSGYFLRNCTSVNEYLRFFDNSSNLLVKYNYKIIDEIQLNMKDFINYSKNIKSTFESFNIPYGKSKIDNDNILSVIRLYCKAASFDILIYSAGYNYARYISIIYKKIS